MSQRTEQPTNPNRKKLNTKTHHVAKERWLQSASHITTCESVPAPESGDMCCEVSFDEPALPGKGEAREAREAREAGEASREDVSGEPGPRDEGEPSREDAPRRVESPEASPEDAGHGQADQGGEGGEACWDDACWCAASRDSEDAGHGSGQPHQGADDASFAAWPEAASFAAWPEASCEDAEPCWEAASFAAWPEASCVEAASFAAWPEASCEDAEPCWEAASFAAWPEASCEEAASFAAWPEASCEDAGQGGEGANAFREDAFREDASCEDWRAASCEDAGHKSGEAG